MPAPWKFLAPSRSFGFSVAIASGIGTFGLAAERPGDTGQNGQAAGQQQAVPLIQYPSPLGRSIHLGHSVDANPTAPAVPLVQYPVRVKATSVQSMEQRTLAPPPTSAGGRIQYGHAAPGAQIVLSGPSSQPVNAGLQVERGSESDKTSRGKSQPESEGWAAPFSLRRLYRKLRPHSDSESEVNPASAVEEDLAPATQGSPLVIPEAWPPTASTAGAKSASASSASPIPAVRQWSPSMLHSGESLRAFEGPSN